MSKIASVVVPVSLSIGLLGGWFAKQWADHDVSRITANAEAEFDAALSRTRAELAEISETHRLELQAERDRVAERLRELLGYGERAVTRFAEDGDRLRGDFEEVAAAVIRLRSELESALAQVSDAETRLCGVGLATTMRIPKQVAAWSGWQAISLLGADLTDPRDASVWSSLPGVQRVWRPEAGRYLVIAQASVGGMKDGNMSVCLWADGQNGTSPAIPGMGSRLHASEASDRLCSVIEVDGDHEFVLGICAPSGSHIGGPDEVSFVAVRIG